jgi:hypothetical protein
VAAELVWPAEAACTADPAAGAALVFPAEEPEEPHPEAGPVVAACNPAGSGLMAADSGVDSAWAPADHSAATADLVVDSSADLAAGHSAEQAGCSAGPAADYPDAPAADRSAGHDQAGSFAADSASVAADRSAEQAGCSAGPAADYPDAPAADRLDDHDPAGSSVADSVSVAVDSSAEQAGCSADPAAEYLDALAADRLDDHDPARSSEADSACSPAGCLAERAFPLAAPVAAGPGVHSDLRQADSDSVDCPAAARPRADIPAPPQPDSHAAFRSVADSAGYCAAGPGSPARPETDSDPVDRGRSDSDVRGPQPLYVQATASAEAPAAPEVQPVLPSVLRQSPAHVD